MEFVYYTTAGIVLYFLSDLILNKMEAFHGDRFKNRSVIFFVIILVLAVSSFKAIELMVS
ncbi:MAG: hypothetical protein OEY09_18010 [Gammaproteobacteria bacterium]|nr:hypothetical protein [Gammaproteobacteria bacterium]